MSDDHQDRVLTKFVYDTIMKIAEEKCTLGFIFGGKDCGKCAVCLIKTVEAKIQHRYVRSWRATPIDHLETYAAAMREIRRISIGSKGRLKHAGEIARKALEEVEGGS